MRIPEEDLNADDDEITAAKTKATAKPVTTGTSTASYVSGSGVAVK
jgi:hypothetical protein